MALKTAHAQIHPSMSKLARAHDTAQVTNMDWPWLLKDLILWKVVGLLATMDKTLITSKRLQLVSKSMSSKLADHLKMISTETHNSELYQSLSSQLVSQTSALMQGMEKLNSGRVVAMDSNGFQRVHIEELSWPMHSITYHNGYSLYQSGFDVSNETYQQILSVKLGKEHEQTDHSGFDNHIAIGFGENNELHHVMVMGGENFSNVLYTFSDDPPISFMQFGSPPGMEGEYLLVNTGISYNRMVFTNGIDDNFNITTYHHPAKLAFNAFSPSRNQELFCYFIEVRDNEGSVNLLEVLNGNSEEDILFEIMVPEIPSKVVKLGGQYSLMVLSSSVFVWDAERLEMEDQSYGVDIDIRFPEEGISVVTHLYFDDGPLGKQVRIGSLY